MDLRETIYLLLLLLLGLSQAHPGMERGGENEIPTDEPEIPTDEPEIPTDEPEIPTAEPEIPTDEPEIPTDEPEIPTAEPEIPTDEPDFVDITSTILTMNNGSKEFLLEGDVWIPRTRSAMRCFNKVVNCLWPKSADGKVKVPFLISDKYDHSEKTKILTAMEEFHSKTCIRFIPRVSQREYLSIQPRYGCFSALGRLGIKQVVSLQRFGCVHHGIIQHELMHALGFYHEHTRSDRDKYVRINWDYVRKYSVYNFKKQNTNNLETPYDYSSIMHYGRTAFTSKFGKETITPIPDTTIPIGQRQGLSDLDVLKLKKLYKCSNRATCG